MHKTLSKAFLTLIFAFLCSNCFAIESAQFFEAIERGSIEQVREFFETSVVETEEELLGFVEDFLSYYREFLDPDECREQLKACERVYWDILEMNQSFSESYFPIDMNRPSFKIFLCKKSKKDRLLLGGVEVMGGLLSMALPFWPVKVLGAWMISDGMKKIFKKKESKQEEQSNLIIT